MDKKKEDNKTRINSRNVCKKDKIKQLKNDLKKITIEERLEQNKKKYEEKYKEVFGKTNKNTREMIEERINKSGWQKFNIEKTGNIRIRCHGKLSKVEKQCPRNAMNGILFCKSHSLAVNKENQKAIIKRAEGYGIYQGADFKCLQEELEEIGEIPESFKTDLTEELKLVLALVRKMLKVYDDDFIAMKPGMFTGKDGIITRLIELKKTYHDIKHDPKVSFTKEQVEYMFVRIKMAMMKFIKDPQILEEISNEIRLVGLEIKQKGWKI